MKCDAPLVYPPNSLRRQRCLDGLSVNPCAACRGFGAPQGIFLAEMQMNKLAEALGMDPVELRVRLVPSDTATSPGSAGSASASRTTFMAGNAVRGAAAAALEKWRA